MAFTMYDYLTDVTPDYNGTLSVYPQDVMYIRGGKEVEIHRGRGRSEERIILSDLSKFWIRMQWRGMTEADHSTIFDFFHDPDKGCDKGFSFYWTPPSQYDSHTYVVRFDSSWESFLHSYQIYGIGAITFYVLGRKAE